MKLPGLITSLLKIEYILWFSRVFSLSFALTNLRINMYSLCVFHAYRHLMMNFVIITSSMRSLFHGWIQFSNTQAMWVTPCPFLGCWFSKGNSIRLFASRNHSYFTILFRLKRADKFQNVIPFLEYGRNQNRNLRVFIYTHTIYIFILYISYYGIFEFREYDSKW